MVHTHIFHSPVIHQYFRENLLYEEDIALRWINFIYLLVMMRAITNSLRECIYFW